ncbi:hypothetical protein C2S52_013385 [Perilla frutescens var. hirtella]|nr:hypothetical protein C2S52_013385 [Perilla frutescens var. hirtella]
MAATSTKLMVLADTIERLGLAYHFESKIDEKLEQVFNSEEDYDLLIYSLLHFDFVCSDNIGIMLAAENKLKENLCGDIEGLLSLYEAAHVRIHDENILDEAMAFTTHELSNMLAELESPMKEKVQQALDYPLHKSLTILNLRFYIPIYEKDELRNELLLRLAKFNFNFLQNIYRNELFQLST